MDMSDQHLDLGALESEERIWRSNGGISMRGNVNGYPFKRSNTANHSLKGGRTHGVKSGRKNKNGWWWIVYSIVVCFFIACFVAHALLQGTLMTFLTPHGQSGAIHNSEVEVDHLDQNHDQNMRLSTLEDAAYSEEIIKFSPSKFLGENPTVVRRNLAQLHPIRHARLALVCSDLSRSPGLLLLFSVATGLQALGYDLELYSLEDGPMRVVWEDVGTSVQVIQSDSEELKVDWLNFDGVFINTLEAKKLVSSLRHEPFNAVPVIWAIHENGLGMRLKEHASSQMTEILDDWNKTFHRADVILFDDYTKPMIYSALDTGSFFVIPGSPIETWEAEHFMATHKRVDLREELGYDVADFVIVVVGSPFLYKGVWLEHTLILQAIMPLLSEFKVESGKDMKLKLIFMSGNSSNYGMALQAIALQLGFPNASVQHVGVDGYKNITLSTADLVIYSSLHEEQAFPAILLRAMSFEKLIVAPKLAIIQKYIEDGKHGLLFPLGNANMITKAMLLAVSNGRLSFLAHQIASAGRLHARNVMASDVIMGYANLLENVLQFPSDVLLPQPASEMPEAVKKGWQWELFMGLYESRTQSSHQNSSKRSMVVQVEDRWRSQRNMAKFLSDTVHGKDATVDLRYWEEERANEMREDVKTREGDELEERSNEPKRTWEDVNRSVKRVERIKDELHERDDGEMERTGQPLCIYEPYYGPGTWPFLHQGALYRGIGLATKSLRTGTDDVDALARLPLLNDSYYRNVLCEYGAYFAIANRVDDIHKNPWIGFQSWRAAGKKVSLSAVAEKKLIEAVTSGRHGNAVYFWVRMDTDVRHTTQGTAFKQQDFWSFCDAINAGNCRSVFTNAFKRMYNLPERWTGLPPMPFDGDFWSGLHSWAMPTSSFLELVMFARMFVDSLDTQYYEKDKSNGTCCLSISKMEQRHCYCRLLELLVNVWAYHSAREMVYVDPQTGLMQEQHSLESRKGKMWVKWFSFDQLKAMDEDLAEEVDYDHPAKKWLWPSTGEIFWQGMYERESQQRYRLKKLKKRKNKEKRDRMQGKYRQKSLGKYKKPAPPEVGNNKRERQTA